MHMNFVKEEYLSTIHVLSKYLARFHINNAEVKFEFTE